MTAFALPIHSRRVARRLSVFALGLLAILSGCREFLGSDADDVAPTVRIQAPPSGFAASAGAVQVSGTAMDDRAVRRLTWSVNGGAETEVAITADDSVAFSFTAALAPGANTLLVTAYDGAGNRGTATIGGSVDTQAPAVALIEPASGTVVSSSVRLRGTATDDVAVTGVTVQLNGGVETALPIAAAAAVSFDAAVELGMGPNAVVLRAYDAAGNRSETTLAIHRAAPATALLTVLDAAGTRVLDAEISAAAVAGATRPAPQVEPQVEPQGGGTYRVTLPAGVAYTLLVGREGSRTVAYHDVVLAAAAETHLEPVRLVGEGAQAGGATIGVVDAQDHQPLAGVSLRLRPGMSNVQGAPSMVEATGQDGRAVVSVPAGHYTVETSREGYAAGHFTLRVSGAETVARGSIPRDAPASEIRMILEWAESPQDLDSHLTGPNEDGDGRFHVYYADPEYSGANGNVIAKLHVDDTSAHGLELMTLHRLRAGGYRYSVHDFSSAGEGGGGLALSLSPARVRVYAGNTLLRTFFVPYARPGTLWTVFEIAGQGIVPVNSMTDQPNAGAVTSRGVPRRKR